MSDLRPMIGMPVLPLPPRDSGPVLEATGLRKIFHMRDGSDYVALQGVDFSLEAGGSLAIVGESGSGKTTAVRIIAGLETATSGAISFANRMIDPTLKNRKNAPRDLQMVFQDPFGSLDPRQRVGASIREVLRTHFSFSKKEVQDRTLMHLEQVGLDERHADQLPRTLSGGQRQRVAIARALALEPKILILDEAVSALDVSVQAQVLNLLREIRERSGISYLFVSHDLGVVRQISDTCIVLQHGRVVERGATSQVLDSPTDPYTQALLEAVPRPGWQPKRQLR